MGMSATAFADIFHQAQSNAPDGKFGAVNTPPGATADARHGKTLFERVSELASGAVRRIGSETAEILSPGNIFVPGGARAARAAADAAENVTEGVKEVAESAAGGIKSGFTIVTVIVVGFLALFLWRSLK